jgi:4-amino-4-deoxy-L-arabinose transferase-like glycosyltransferase
VTVRGGPRDAAAAATVPELAVGVLLALAAGATVVLLAFAGRNGYHRDELYFLAASRHLAFGYVDQPPVAVLVAWLGRVAFGNTLVGLRVVPALLSGGVVFLTGAIARELGGSRFAQGFAALAVATTGLLVVGHLEGPTVYDVFAWTLTTLLVVRILRTGSSRLWIAVGVTVGVGLEAKQTILLLLGGLAVGLVVNRQAGIFRSGWLWAGAAIAVALWAPNLVWQAIHHWPTRSMDANLRAEHSGLEYAIKYPFIVLLALGAFVAPVWIAGWWSLWNDPRVRRYRAFAVAFAIAFVAVWIVIPDRFYYIFGLFPVLVASGASVAEGVADGARGFLRAQPRRRRLWRSRRWAVGLVSVSGLVLLPLALPVLPPSALASVPLQNVNYNLGEEIGWHDLVHEVAAVKESLPPSQQRSVAIVTSNYGEAGAIDRFGAAAGLPTAYSGHNSFSWWGPPRPDLGTTIGIGLSRDDLTPYFTSVRLATTIHNRHGVDNDEEGERMWLATGQKQPWSEIWPHFRHYG